jgi:hypothetical protein
MVPYDALIAGDYDAFIGARAQRIHDAVIRLCRGETLDQPQPTIGAVAEPVE